MNKKQEKEFDKLLPCIQSGCSNDGIIPEQDGEGDWQPTQCEYCCKVRFPIKDFINKLLKEEEEENFSANRLLFDRFTEWQNEWQAEKPKERALTHHDLKRLIEWKIEKLLKEERERTLKIIDEIIGYGDIVEGGIAEGVLILVKSKIDKKDIN